MFWFIVVYSVTIRSDIPLERIPNISYFVRRRVFFIEYLLDKDTEQLNSIFEGQGMLKDGSNSIEAYYMNWNIIDSLG